MDIYKELVEEISLPILKGLQALRNDSIDRKYIQELMANDIKMKLFKSEEEAEQLSYKLNTMRYPTINKIEALLQGRSHFKPVKEPKEFNFGQMILAQHKKELEAIENGTWKSKYQNR